MMQRVVCFPARRRPGDVLIGWRQFDRDALETRVGLDRFLKRHDGNSVVFFFLGFLVLVIAAAENAGDLADGS